MPPSNSELDRQAQDRLRADERSIADLSSQDSALFQLLGKALPSCHGILKSVLNWQHCRIWRRHFTLEQLAQQREIELRNERGLEPLEILDCTSEAYIKYCTKIRSAWDTCSCR